MICPSRVSSTLASFGGLDVLGQAEVEHLHPAVRAHHDVGRLEVAVDDAAGVRGGQRFGNRHGDRQQLVQLEAARRNQPVERRALAPAPW